MLQQTLSFARRFVDGLIAQAIASSTINEGRPLNAAMWPPHRRAPTPPKNRKPADADRFRMAVVDGRVTLTEPLPKLVGGKGLCP